jgi:hypothetical protein
MPPNKLIIPSDGNVLELVRTIKGKEISYEYKFTKSETKKGMLMTISEENLNKNLKQSKAFIKELIKQKKFITLLQ